MSKVARAAREGARKNILELTADKTLAFTDTGKTILLNSTSALAVTLPDVATAPVGTFYRFVVITANNNAYTITTADTTDSTGDMFIGGVTYGDNAAAGDGDGTDNISLIVPGADDNKITLDANLTDGGGQPGTRIECLRVSATQWLVSGVVITSDADGTGAAIFSDVD
jgi:hypothetical protein